MFPSPAGGITSDLAAVLCSLVEWLVVLSEGLGVRDCAMKLTSQIFATPHPQPFSRLREKGVKRSIEIVMMELI
jgi:hypothetical protein